MRNSPVQRPNRFGIGSRFSGASERMARRWFPPGRSAERYSCRTRYGQVVARLAIEDHDRDGRKDHEQPQAPGTL